MSLSKEILEKMSLEAKIGQLFFVRPEALENQIDCDKKPTI